MITKSIEYSIRCNKCKQYLFHSEDCTLISYRGHIIKEGSTINIQDVAKDNGWDISDKGHFCKTCK